MFVSGKSRTAFFPTDNLIDGISCDGSKNFDVRTCEHMILGQLRMGARHTKNAPLVEDCICICISGRFLLWCSFSFATLKYPLQSWIAFVQKICGGYRAIQKKDVR